MRPSKLRTGIIFIGLGVALLLYNMDRLHTEYFFDLLHLWPVLLVAIGIEIIARHSNAPMLGYLSPLLIAGSFVYAGYGQPMGWDSSSWISFGDDGGLLRTEDRTFKPDFNYSEARVYVDLYDGELKIDGGAEFLGQAEFTSSGRIPSSLSSDDEDRAIMRIRQSGSSRRSAADMNLELSSDVPLVLDLKGRDADIDIDGTTLMLQRLYIELDKGMAGVTVGTLEDSLWASVDPGRSRVKLRVPEGAGVRLEGDVGDTEIDWGSLQTTVTDDAIATDNFDTARPKITLRLAGSAREIKIEPY